MARYTFDVGRPYLGRLHAVREKPVENARLKLLRLEFEIFQPIDSQVVSTGKLACRDIVVGPGLDLTADPVAGAFVAALHVNEWQTSAGWLHLNETRPWVEIVFGPVAETDLRNVFRQILPFDLAGHAVREFEYDLSQGWVTSERAARDLRKSASTIRRLLTEHEPQHGGELVRRTAGNHRRINLRLLRNLID